MVMGGCDYFVAFASESDCGAKADVACSNNENAWLFHIWFQPILHFDFPHFMQIML